MNKDNPDISSEWSEDHKFKQFLREYIKKDAYRPQDDKLRIFVTYKTLYRIYTATLYTKSNVQKFDKELAKLNATTDKVEKGLTSLGFVIKEQENINKSMRFQAKILSVVIIGLLFLLIYYLYPIFQ